MEKPKLGIGSLINLSFGFLGIQIGFGLQNANMTRMFQSLGESLDNLPVLWAAAPLTGLLVQPIIGHFSDKTWGAMGRRRPYFLAGAILAALALFIMPMAPILWFAAMMLWVLDASINITMEPFRAFVGDMLRKDQHTSGYAVQTALIGIGAVIGSAFPAFLTMLGVSNEAIGNGIPDSVKYSFWFGGIAMLFSVLWTIFTTKEYSPEEMASFERNEMQKAAVLGGNLAQKPIGFFVTLLFAGLVIVFATNRLALEKEVYLLGGLFAGYGALGIIAVNLAKSGRGNNFLAQIVGDFSGMPPLMKKLAVAQFFSWSALFIMWIYTTPVVAQYFYGSSDAKSALFNEAGNWVGILFSVYNGVAAVAALLLLPWLTSKVGKAKTHMICLLLGALGFASFLFLRDPKLLLLSEVFVGIAWASILAMPYAILASSLPQNKLGIFMGIFNAFIVIPQLIVATLMGSVLKAFFPTEPIWTMAFAALVMAIAGLAMLRIDESKGE
jgi:maltose/moltooligosaccharide transporter